MHRMDTGTRTDADIGKNGIKKSDRNRRLLAV